MTDKQARETGIRCATASCRWSAYPIMAEGLKLTAQSFTADVTRLSCCAG